MNIRYAVMITLPGATDSDVDKGYYSGSLCWITGDELLASPTGLPTNPVTEEAQEDWALGMLMEDSFGSPSFDVDIDALGSYGNQSDMELRANLVRLTVAWLYTHSLYRAEVRFYVVIDEEFFQWCAHVVESFTYEAQTLNIYGVDVSKDAHKELPRAKTDRNAFPRISTSQEAKYIPICIGRIPKAVMIGVSGDGERLPMYTAGGVDYYQTAAEVLPNTNLGNNKNILRMITGDLNVAENEWARKFLTCVRNGPNDHVEIQSNEASSGGFTILRLARNFAAANTDEAIRFWRNPQLVVSGTAEGGGSSFIDLGPSASLVGSYAGQLVYISSGPGAGQGAIISAYLGGPERRAVVRGEWSVTPTSSSTWQIFDQTPPSMGFQATWFQINSLSFSYLVSHNPVYQFPEGRRAFFWDGEAKKFWSAQGIVSTVHPGGLPGYGAFPGAQVQGVDTKLSNAVMQSFIGFTPSAVRFVSLEVTGSDGNPSANFVLESENFPSAGSSCPELFDVDKETFLTWTASKTSTADLWMQSMLHLEIDIPEIDYDAGIDSLFVAFKISHELECADDVVMSIEQRWGVEAIDTLEATGITQNNNVARPQLIVRQSFNEARVLESVYTADGEVNLINGIAGDYFGDTEPPSPNHQQTMSQSVLMDLTLDRQSMESVKTLRLRIRSISRLWTPAEVVETEDNEHIYKVISKLHEVCLYAKKKVDDPPEQILIPVIGDMFQGTWGGRRTSGNPILSPADAAEQIIRQYDGRPDLIDTASFDLGVTDRPGSLWPVSMQLLDGKNSAEYLDQLCEEAMFIITPRHDGTRALRCWRERFTAELLLSESEIIEDSIREVGDVDLRRVFNEFELRYDKNLADDSHQRTVAIRNVDADAFPGELDVDADPVDLSSAIVGFRRENGFVVFTFEIAGLSISPGMRVSLTGGPGGFALDRVAIVGVQTDPDNPIVGHLGDFTIPDEGYTMLTEGVHYTDFDFDTCTLYPSQILLWKQYVVGVPDYEEAQDLWEPCHEAWLITRSKNTLRLDFEFFGSQSDWGGDPLLEPVLNWLRLAVGPNGLTKPWKRTAFQLPITEVNLGLELGHGFAFRHNVFTDGKMHYAWFTRLALNAKECRIDVEIVFNPWTEV